jgi:outer membrane protein TolC
VQLAFAQDRYQGGVGSKLDVTRSGQEAQASEAQLQTTLAALTKAREALGVLMGSEDPVEAKGEPELRAPTELEPALARASEDRTDVRASKQRLSAARRSVSLHYTDFLPILSATGQVAYQNPPTLTQPLRTWQVQLVLTLPFYDGGLRYGQQKERVAQEREAEFVLEAALRQARSETRSAFDSLRHADLALDAAREGARLAGESLKLAEIAYHTGVSTNLELVDAQRRARDADTAAAIAEDNARQARLDLLAASGAFP